MRRQRLNKIIGNKVDIYFGGLKLTFVLFLTCHHGDHTYDTWWLCVRRFIHANGKFNHRYTFEINAYIFGNIINLKCTGVMCWRLSCGEMLIASSLQRSLEVPAAFRHVWQRMVGPLQFENFSVSWETLHPYEIKYFKVVLIPCWLPSIY